MVLYRNVIMVSYIEFVTPSIYEKCYKEMKNNE